MTTQGPTAAGTGGDRQSIDLPADQRALAAAVLAQGKPTAIVLVNGGAVPGCEIQGEIPRIQYTARAIKYTFYVLKYVYYLYSNH